jgi:hypothetical protein
MTPNEMGGWIGGIVGGVIGLAGAAIGTYFSIKNTHSPRERAFMVQSAVVCWVAGLVFLTLLFVLPNPYRWLLWIPYSIMLPLGIIYGNRRQQAIRQEDAQQAQGDETR